MIIGRAGGLGDGPREKVAGTEEQISLPGGEENQYAPGVSLNFPVFPRTVKEQSCRGY